MEPGLQCTVAVLLRVWRPWFVKHPECLPLAIDCLARTLDFPDEDELFPMKINEDHVGAIALDFLTTVPGAEAAFEALFEAYRSHLLRYPWVISPAALRFVLGALAQTVAHMQDEASAAKAAEMVVTTLATNMEQHVEDSDSVVFHLQSFKVLASNLQNRHHPGVVRSVFETLFAPEIGFILRVINHYASHEEIIKASHDVGVALIVSDSSTSPELSQIICGSFLNIYSSHRWPCALKVLKVCVEQYGESPVLSDFLQGWTQQILQSTTADVLVQSDPALAEALFHLLSALACHSHELLLQFLEHVFDAILLPAITTPSQVLLNGNSAMALFSFLQTLFTQKGELEAAVGSLVSNQVTSMRLMFGLLSCICGWSPSWMLDDLIATLREWIMFQGVEPCHFAMAAAISQQDFPRAAVSDAAKDIFLGDMLRFASESQWSKLKNAVKKFCGGKKKGESGMPSKKNG